MKPYAQTEDSSGAATALTDDQIATMVESYIPLVLSQVDRVWLSSRIGLTRDDLISAGCYGLLLAARRFDPTRGVGFGVFARPHVHGALMREINLAMRATDSGDDDILMVSADQVEIESVADESAADADRGAEEAMIRDLMECVLTEHERTMLALYYYEELTIAEVAAVLTVSPSAAARTIKGALAKLKSAIANRERGEP